MSSDLLYEASSFYDSTDIIIIFGAVPQEITLLVQNLGHPEKKNLWGIPYWQGHLFDKQVIVTLTGIGKTFTAMTSTLFIREFRPHLVLMTGTGARINSKLRTGDVIVASRLCEHDYGSLISNGEMVYRSLNSPDDGREIVNEFKPNSNVLDWARKAIETYPVQDIVIDEKTHYQNRVCFGTVASSDLFGVPQTRIDSLRNDFQVDIMEMESAPFGLVCQMFHVPYLVIRSGSNVAQEEPNQDYLQLSPFAACEAAKFTLHLIKNLP